MRKNCDCNFQCTAKNVIFSETSRKVVRQRDKTKGRHRTLEQSAQNANESNCARASDAVKKFNSSAHLAQNL